MKKTLIICSHYPLPEATGANMRTMHFVRFFQQLGSVDIAYTYVLDGAQTGDPTFRGEITLALTEQGRYRWQFLTGVMTRRPVPIFQYQSASHKAIMSRISLEDYDYILVRYVYSTGPLFNLPARLQRRVIIDFDDIISGSLYDQMIGNCDGAVKKLILGFNRRLIQRYERRCLKFGASFFCSERDRLKVSAGNGNSNAFVIPNIYHNKAFEDYDFGDGFENKNILLFVGTLFYEPNVRGLRWFIKSIFTRYRKEFPDSKLLVVGRFPSREIKSLCENYHAVELYEDVPEIRQYYKRCWAVVVPLLSGGGTRIKILEAAMANRPILSTPVGAEGLDLADGTDILLFKNTHEFLTQHNKLQDRKKYTSLIQNARKVVERNYSEQQFKNLMGNMLSEMQRHKY